MKDLETRTSDSSYVAYLSVNRAVIKKHYTRCWSRKVWSRDVDKGRENLPYVF